MLLRLPLTLCLLLVLSVCGNKLESSISSISTLQQIVVFMKSAILGLVRTEPDCSGTNKGELVEDPDDCTSFYLCEDSDEFIGPIPCDEGFCFEPRKSDCIEIKDPSTCGCSDLPQQCVRNCSGVGDQLFDFDDCTKYKTCISSNNEDAHIYECPADRPWWDGKVCGTDPLKCCNCQVPTCMDGDEGNLLADPSDCHSYYLCFVLGDELITQHLTCEDGGSFIPEIGQCNVHAKECSDICPDA